jgi:hypothetical protein
MARRRSARDDARGGPAIAPRRYLQTFALVHDLPEGHCPHCRVPPQPSEADPQEAPTEAHVFGVQALLPELPPVPPPVQTPEMHWPEEHVPHWREPLQPSEAAPHETFCAAHVFGAQGLVQVPDVHDWPEAHAPHCRRPVQPSDAGPHETFCAAHVFGAHVPVPQTPEMHAGRRGTLRIAGGCHSHRK